MTELTDPMTNRGFHVGVIAGIGALLLLSNTRSLRAQTTMPNWEEAAGGEMTFDVASVKQNKSGDPPFGSPSHSNVNLTAFDTYAPNGG
ncbi:MAG: hypothetical protein ACRD40_04540 [Candidatus Acidiferrales bacterium]